MPERSSPEFLSFQEAVLGRYSLEREIGRGGMGTVYLAHEVALDRPVALKVMPPAYAAQPALRERFLREARTAAKLSHPNIVPIHAVAEVGDFVFFAMAYIAGETLGERVRNRGPVPSKQAVKILQEVSWALAYAHAEGVVHRDVKPDNILLEDSGGRALVTDFGIAHVAQEPGMTTAGEVLGTAEFMSPEQASGEEIGPASDIYSLGVVGHYTLTGKLPFEGSTVASVLAKHLTQAPPPVASAAPEVPASMGSAIDRCLAKDPAERFGDGGSLAEALGAGTAVARDLPVPLRVFVRAIRDIATAMPLIVTLWVFVFLMPLTADVAEWPTAIILLVMAMVVGPLGIMARDARRLMAAGYTLEDARLAVADDLERRLEELRFEYGKGLTWVDKALRWLSAGGFATAMGALAMDALLPGAEWIVGTFLAGINVGVFSMFGAALRNKRRRDWIGDMTSWLAESTFSTWAFGLGKLGLKRKAITAGAHRPTEMAISIAADRLFDELPKPLRRELAGLPQTIDRLEADAKAMRRRVEELDEVIAELGEGPAHVTDDAEHVHARAGLERTREEARNRMTDAVTALERIRLGLLRLHAGDNNVASLTMELGSATELSTAIERLLEGQRQVSRLLRPPELRTDP